MKPVKAWAVVSPRALNAWGNGDEFQYPVFPSHHDARDWVAHQLQEPRLQIVRVVISEARKGVARDD